MRGFGFELIVHGVAVHGSGAAGTPSLAVEADQSSFGGVLIARATVNEHRAVDEGQLVILLQEDDNAVL